MVAAQARPRLSPVQSKIMGAAWLWGKRLSGKPSVQQIFTLSGGAAVKLTVAHYYSPSGVDIHKIGVVPDIEDPWFSRSEIQMLRKLQIRKEIEDFIESNGDDILSQLEKARQRLKRGHRGCFNFEEIPTTGRFAYRGRDHLE